MTKYDWQWEYITVQDIRALCALADSDSTQTFMFLCKLMKKAGLDVDELPLTEFGLASAEFMEGVGQFLDGGEVWDQVRARTEARNRERARKTSIFFGPFGSLRSPPTTPDPSKWE